MHENTHTLAHTVAKWQPQTPRSAKWGATKRQRQAIMAAMCYTLQQRAVGRQQQQLVKPQQKNGDRAADWSDHKDRRKPTDNRKGKRKHAQRKKSNNKKITNKTKYDVVKAKSAKWSNLQMQQSVTLGGCSRRKAEATCNVNAAIVGRQHKRALIMEVLAARAIRNLFFLHYFLCLCSFFFIIIFFFGFSFFPSFWSNSRCSYIRDCHTYGPLCIYKGIYVCIEQLLSERMCLIV